MADTGKLCNFLVSSLMLLCNGNRGEEVTEDTVAELTISTAAATDLICTATAPMGNYDVFLNHRGPDVKKSFADHLSDSFEAAGIHCFVDYKSIHSGEENWDAIEHAIHHSKVHIAVFSPGYAASSWCLRELVNILECRSRGRSQLFLPIFFNVCPSDLRHIDSASSKSCYSSAFLKLARRNDSQEMQNWMNALKEASMVHGWTLQDTAQGFEARLVKLIVSEVLNVLNRTILDIAKYPVGVNEKLQLALGLMQIDKVQKGFHKLGIYGMGGVGKTTLAKSIYNAIYREFDFFYFIEGVRSEARAYGLQIVQERMLGALLKSKETIPVSNTSHGKQILRERLSNLKILLILDDVDNREQLEALLPFDSCCLKDGSQIVITTRDEQIVIWAKVHHRHFMEGLNKSDSHLLFNWHAFLRQEEPSEDFKALAGKVIHACNGVPLALETLGAHLYGKDMDFWVATVKVLKGHQHTLTPAQREVTAILRISFDGLGSEEERLMFLDIACFMLGEREDRAKRLWCETDAAVLYFETLRLKCLVKIDEERNLTMHDLLRDMGREIVVERSHKNVWERSHLWNEDEVRVVLQHEKGTSLVRGVKLLTLEEGREEWGVKSFAGMDFLRFLVLSGNGHITGNFSLFPKELRWFQWHWCPLEFLPSQLTLSKVVVLDLSWSQISSLSQGGHRFENLRELVLIGCKFICKELPDFGVSCKNLEKLDLSNCRHLKSVPKGIGCLTSLTRLDFTKCKGLTVLPESIGSLRSLTLLDLNMCEGLTVLPESIGSLRSLSRLNLRGCRGLTVLPESIGNLERLTLLDLNGCLGLTVLPESIGRVRTLTLLDLRGCRGLMVLPESIGSLRSLTRLDLGWCGGLMVLPESIGSLRSLTLLDLNGCRGLTVIPKSTGSLRSLTLLYLLRCEGLTVLPESIGSLRSLTLLDLGGCRGLTGLPESIGNLRSLTRLDLGGCGGLTVLPKSISSLRSLTLLDLGGCRGLMVLPESIGSLKSLTLLDLGGCRGLMVLPESIGSLRSLTRLDLGGCWGLTVLPESIGSLGSLALLDLDGCRGLTTLPESIGNLRSLTLLDLSWCGGLTVLPESIGSFKSLTRLDLGGCRGLTMLTESIGSLGSLTRLDLCGCGGLTVLPESIGSLESLTLLDLGACQGLTVLPESIGSLGSLTLLDLGGCGGLTVLPESIDSLGSLTLLDLSRCGGLTVLPESIGSLGSLIRLDLGGCGGLTVLPESTGSLRSLTRLDLGRCGGLTVLPESIDSLDSLTLLDLGGCRGLKMLPKSIGSLRSLIRLDLGRCGGLTMLPECIGSLRSLTFLDLGRCEGLTVLPETIGRLRSLTRLDLGGCRRLTVLPESIGSLISLTFLDLRGCRGLTVLPESIGSLRSLTRLDLGGCGGLTVLPESIGSLRSLIRLDLGGCWGLTVLPESIGSLRSLDSSDLVEIESVHNR
ncbi:hypothetical protein GOP47_0005752 [Adiantum capillus-veneris]|uniref:TIR domain-containing protein n=1 Tax=Adiantum capillus-veneris TaxID=13818 RepID=A0A9D4V4P7_ADICA|nr:hypothetical protein GOP47_0005219 [Adiantum capillus-veneris]KAI5080273.1 hypothetical protein GOP47_0005752 [Adiantum capillus-veneris]